MAHSQHTDRGHLEQKYGEYDKGSPARAMGRQLKKFSHVRPGERCLIVAGDNRKELERLAGEPIESAEELVRRFKRLQNIDLAGVSVELSDAQKRYIAANAEFWGKTPEVYLQERLDELLASVAGDK